jgi:hypothetical protein
MRNTLPGNFSGEDNLSARNANALVVQESAWPGIVADARHRCEKRRLLF